MHLLLHIIILILAIDRFKLKCQFPKVANKQSPIIVNKCSVKTCPIFATFKVYFLKMNACLNVRCGLLQVANGVLKPSKQRTTSLQLSRS